MLQALMRPKRRILLPPRRGAGAPPWQALLSYYESTLRLDPRWQH